VDLDLDAFERENLRTEARGRLEAGEKRAARTRGEVTGVEPERAASSWPTGSRFESGDPARRLGKWETGGGGGRAPGRPAPPGEPEPADAIYAAGAGRWWAGLPASPCRPG
jgi:hypothetical protein